VWSDEVVERTGARVVDVPFVTIGGGLGSLAMVHLLRVAGVAASDIGVLSDVDLPYHNFRRLAEASQIGPDDVLRSGSEATVDAIWGWPGYALRQAGKDRRLLPIWTVLTEPILSEFFIPRARDVYESAERESRRLSWSSMLVQGRVRMVRPRVGGGYFVLLALPGNEIEPPATVFRCSYVHMAVGYSSPRLLPNLQDFRLRHADSNRVVNAYEPHEHVYAGLRERPSAIIVRGSGIVASRILQRLLDDRERYGLDVRVHHVFRTYVRAPAGPLAFRRDGGEGFSYQPFNFPRAAFGGQLKARLEGLKSRPRADLIHAMGGTSTARRSSWRRQIHVGLRGGWYRQHIAEITGIEPAADGNLRASLRLADGTPLELDAAYVIDATGLEDHAGSHELLQDLVDHCGAYLNALGRLEVTPTFEVRGTRNPPGRLYASGAMTLGGSYAPVDSFLGLQHAALCICDDLADLEFCGRIGIARSARQWWRWARNRQP
jgi:hypothetical protein